MARLTGLADADLVDAPLLPEVADSFRELLLGRTLVAHNADFERSFLSRFLDSKLADATYLDTLDLLAVTHPELFEFSARPIAVALEDPVTRGMTVVDERYSGRQGPHQVQVAYQIDAQRAFQLLYLALAVDPD